MQTERTIYPARAWRWVMSAHDLPIFLNLDPYAPTELELRISGGVKRIEMDDEGPKRFSM